LLGPDQREGAEFFLFFLLERFWFSEAETRPMDGGGASNQGAVQLPMLYQPLLSPDRSAANAYKGLEPLKPLLKLRERLAVTLTPATVKRRS